MTEIMLLHKVGLQYNLIEEVVMRTVFAFTNAPTKSLIKETRLDTIPSLMQASRFLSWALFASCLFPAQAEADFTQQTQKLTVSDAIPSAYGVFLGGSVALSANGDTAIVGGPRDNTTTGAAWIFTRSRGVLSQVKLAPVSTFTPWLAQGQSVAISADGNTALIGADNVIYVMSRSSGGWAQQAQLTVPNSANTCFGCAVGLSGDGNTAIVGAHTYNDVSSYCNPEGQSSACGAVWVFSRSGATWSQGTRLFVNDAVGAPELGYSVSLSHDGNTALVGGAYDTYARGAAFVLTRSEGVWAQQGPKLVGLDVTFYGHEGWSVSLSGDGNTALIGGPTSDDDRTGAAWVFARSGSTWTRQAKLEGVMHLGA